MRHSTDTPLAAILLKVARVGQAASKAKFTTHLICALP